MSDKIEYFEKSNVKNDVIDFKSDPDVSIKKLGNHKGKSFHILLEGNSIDRVIVNTIRRAIMMYIPVYGFHRSNITIERNHSMYNYDMIYCQLETLNIYDVPNYFDLENPEIFLSNEALRKLFGNFLRETSVPTTNVDDENKKLFDIELSFNIKNSSHTEDKFLSTHDGILKINGEIVDNYKKYEPDGILVLKPGEEISLVARANLSIAEISAIYEATTNAYMKEISPSKYELEYETLGQLDKNLIFTKACIITTKKLENFTKFIKSSYKDEPDKSKLMVIDIHGEEHTLGNLISNGLQKSKYVKSAGYKMKHPFVQEITIEYMLEENSAKGPIEVLVEVLEYIIEVYRFILHKAFKPSD